MNASPAAPLRFGRFELRPDEGRLLDAGVDVPLGNRAFDVLRVLAARAGALVGKNELLDLAWPNVVVEENNLQVQISTLRKVLGADIITTVPGRGYRLALPVDASAGGGPLAGGPWSGAGVPVTGTRMPAPPTRHSNLPATLPPLIGRTEDAGALGARLDAHRLVTLAGTGGIGKTALALHAASERSLRCAHGVALVELAPLRDADAVPAAVATALDVRLGAGDAGAALVSALAPLDLLLVLDNAEHLVDAVAAIVADILVRAPNVRILVTSQLPLRVAGEEVMRLDTLAVPPVAEGLRTPADALRFAAVALFVERVRRVQPRFALVSADVPAVVDIVRRLDGLPLALELAAARVPLLGVGGVAARLDERWRLLALGARDADVRHRSLHALLDWSHDLLAEPEQRVLRRLAVFVDGFTLELAEAVASDDMLDRWAVVDALQGLVDRSLVNVDAAEPPRYRLLESMQAFAFERLHDRGEEATVRQRHARAMRDCFAGAAGDVVTFRALGAEGARLQAEWRNGKAAAAWGITHDPSLAVAIVAHLRIGMPSGMRRELHAMLDATESFVTDAVPASDRAAWYLVSSHMNAGRMAKAADHAQRSFELFRGLGDSLGTFRACIRRVINLSMSDPARSAVALAELRALEHPALGPMALAVAAEAAYMHEHFTGQAAAAVEDGLRAEACYRACGDAESMRRIQANLVDTMLQAERHDEAVALGASLVAALRGTRDLGPLTYAELNLATGLLALRRTAEARAPLAEAWSHAPLYGVEGECAAQLAFWCAQELRYDSALRLAGFSEARFAAHRHAVEELARRSLAEVETVALAVLGAQRVRQCKEAGALLGVHEVAALAFG